MISDKAAGWFLFLGIAVAVALAGFALGLWAGQSTGRDQGCQNMCKAQYAWWGPEGCVCAKDISK